MKKVGVLVCLIMMVATIFAPAVFADKKSDAVPTAGLELISSSPEDGAKGVSVENLSVELRFNKDVRPENAKERNANLEQFTLTTKKGKKLPIKVYYSDKEEGLMMVVCDNIANKITIEGDTQYVLTIGENFKATDGTLFGQEKVISFRTLDQGKSTMVYMVLMIIMMVGMVVYTTKSTKKAMEKDKQTKGKSETVNPYKEAKKTGKSVEEIVAKDKERKAKEAAAREKARAKEAQILAELEAKEKAAEEVSAPNTFKFKNRPKPISEAGAKYRVKVVKTQPEKKKGSTNPKGQSGKQKNSKNKGKK